MTPKKTGKAKSAVTGQYVTRQAVKVNPRETFVSTPNPKHVVLRLADLSDLCALAEAQLDFVNNATYNRIHDELIRAIAAHKKASK